MVFVFPAIINHKINKDEKLSLDARYRGFVICDSKVEIVFCGMIVEYEE